MQLEKDLESENPVRRILASYPGLEDISKIAKALPDELSKEPLPAQTEKIIEVKTPTAEQTREVGFDISGFWELPVDWDILVAASDSYLRDGPIAKGKIINQTPASVSYGLSLPEDSSDLGYVRIRKLRAGLSELYITGVPLGAEKINTKSDQELRDEMEGQEPQVIRDAIHEKWRQDNQKREKRRAKILNIQAMVINGYFGVLKRENIWPVEQDERPKETIVKQKGGNLPSSITSAEIDHLRFDVAEMKGLFQDFTAARAYEILKAVPAAWNKYQSELSPGQWGPKWIGEQSICPPATVSNYLRVLHHKGLRTIDGIEIPHRTKRNSTK